MRTPFTIDATAFVGDYPFRGFPQTSPDALKKLAQKYLVGKAVVSSFQELFWENNFDAAKRVSEEIQDDSFYAHFLVVNPVYPRQIESLPAVLSATGAAGLRLMPKYHGYRLWDERVGELFRFAAEQNLPVQIFREIQDERMHWMHAVPPVASADFDWLLSSPPPCKVLLSGLPFHEIGRLGEALRAATSVWCDLSRVRGPVFSIEKLVQEQKIERLLFGSLWPIQIIGSSLLPIAEARIGDSQRQGILSENWREFSHNFPDTF